jgi:hypothetical protein
MTTRPQNGRCTVRKKSARFDQGRVLRCTWEHPRVDRPHLVQEIGLRFTQVADSRSSKGEADGFSSRLISSGLSSEL